MPEPVHFHTSEQAEYHCPNGHVVVIPRAEDVAWFSVDRGHCSRCEEEWQSYVDDHRDDWPAILDDNFPADPTFFEWTDGGSPTGTGAQYHRKGSIGR